MKKFIVLMCLSTGLLFGSLGLGAGSVGAQEVSRSPEGDQITRLYRTTLGRDADPDGHRFWTERLQAGEPIERIALRMMGTAEAHRQTSGDPIVDAYRWALGREPDASGYAHWAGVEVVTAVLSISDSPEHRRITGTMPPVPPPAHPEGWINTGHGIHVPPVLLQIRYCESRNNYVAANPRSTARGAYQFLYGSWAAYGHAERYGVAEAHLATPAQQDEAALLTWERDGTRPWLASRHCWG